MNLRIHLQVKTLLLMLREGWQCRNLGGRVFQREGLGGVKPPEEESTLGVGEEEWKVKPKTYRGGDKGNQPGK